MIVARDSVAAAPHQVFAVLADLDRHRALTDDGMEILSLDGPPGARTGGLVVLRGPLGLRRMAHTRVEGFDAGRRLWGAATTARGTRAELAWSLEPLASGTAVEVRVRLSRSHWSDRLLLSLGGTRWLRRRLVVALGRLDRLAGVSYAARGARASRARPPEALPSRAGAPSARPSSRA